MVYFYDRGVELLLMVVMDRFPYLDTMYMLDKWGPGVVFYGHATTEEIDDFELRLKKGERFATLYLEAPGNPLCQTPDFGRLKKLSLEYGFPIVIDDTIGSWANVDALKFADIAATSLSKAFSGYCDVLGGWQVLLCVFENTMTDTVFCLASS